MQICKNVVSKKVYVLLEENKNNQAYFISPDGSIKLYDKAEFEEFIEDTDVIYLKAYMVITAEQYRSYRNYIE
jgi:hypothetical protein